MLYGWIMISTCLKLALLELTKTSVTLLAVARGHFLQPGNVVPKGNLTTMVSNIGTEGIPGTEKKLY
jgi:hypothetical protein